jgi:hypothetical protein
MSKRKIPVVPEGYVLVEKIAVVTSDGSTMEFKSVGPAFTITLDRWFSLQNELMDSMGPEAKET